MAPSDALEVSKWFARILVADDKVGMREGCREVLAAEGHEVDTAGDGLEHCA